MSVKLLTKEKAVIITVVNENNAKIGYEFVKQGLSEECLKCPLKHVCIDRLEEGRIYQVVMIRKKEHYCKLINSKVRVVGVIESNVVCTIPTKMAFEGAIITYNRIKCDEVKCTNLMKCNPIGLKNGDKCRVVRRIGKADCIKGKLLAVVILSRIF